MAGVFEGLRRARRKGPLHMTLLDPASGTPATLADTAALAERFGTDAIMVGGSTGVTSENLDATVKAMKAACSLPVIHFPNSAGALSTAVDAIYFMSTLNSRDPRFIVGEQVRGAPYVAAAGIETISMGYVIFEPGMTVGRVSRADLVPRDASGADATAAYAHAARFLGMQALYLEAGSGADEPVPATHVKAARAATDAFLLVGGGIRSGADAEPLLAAGADCLVTGTIAENGEYKRLEAVVAAVRGRRGTAGDSGRQRETT